jgi:hypothetical protein
MPFLESASHRTHFVRNAHYKNAEPLLRLLIQPDISRARNKPQSSLRSLLSQDPLQFFDIPPFDVLLSSAEDQHDMMFYTLISLGRVRLLPEILDGVSPRSSLKRQILEFDLKGRKRAFALIYEPKVNLVFSQSS